MMKTCPVMTIGIGQRSMETFLDTLGAHGVRYLIDLRSKPYSRYRPEFNREALQRALKERSITYVYMGDTIGGLPEDRSCYTDNAVDYDKVRQKDFYRAGIARVVKAYEGGHRIVLMCAEEKPERCHRSKLVGVTLEERGVPVVHIDEKGALRSQDEVIRSLTGGQMNLFGSETDELRSRGRY